MDEIKPLSGWDPYYYNVDWTNDANETNVVPRLPIDDDVICATDEGIYVHRAGAAGSVYYAVSRVVNGEENLSNWTAGGNTSSAAVSESVGTGITSTLSDASRRGQRRYWAAGVQPGPRKT